MSVACLGESQACRDGTDAESGTTAWMSGCRCIYFATYRQASLPLWTPNSSQVGVEVCAGDVIGDPPTIQGKHMVRSNFRSFHLFKLKRNGLAVRLAWGSNLL